MLLLADSGSTKCSWLLSRPSHEPGVYKTPGINPYYQTTRQIINSIKSDLLPQITFPEKISQIFFYGAGCSGQTQCDIVKEALAAAFPRAKIEVQNDLLAAARALFGDEKGIACISGTGSNSGYYNGYRIEQNIRSLGLYLGDEGSGGHLGKLLVRDYLRNQLPKELTKMLEEFTTDRSEQMMEHVYKKEFPNRYLASFAPFVTSHLDHPYMKQLAEKSFVPLFDEYICRYPHYEELPVGFIGSVAYHLQDILQEIAVVRRVTITNIMRSPADGLLKYHTK